MSAAAAARPRPVRVPLKVDEGEILLVTAHGAVRARGLAADLLTALAQRIPELLTLEDDAVGSLRLDFNPSNVVGHLSTSSPPVKRRR